MINLQGIKITSHDPIRCGQCQRFISKQEETTEKLKREVNARQHKTESHDLRFRSNSGSVRARAPITTHRGNLEPSLTEAGSKGYARQAIELGLCVVVPMLTVFGLYELFM